MSTHNWSGWPGAFCLKCGQGDPIEEALALDLFDPGGPLPEGGYAPEGWSQRPEDQPRVQELQHRISLGCPVDAPTSKPGHCIECGSPTLREFCARCHQPELS